MDRMRWTRRTNRTFSVLALPMAALLLVSACKIDQPATQEREAGTAGEQRERPVFGEPQQPEQAEHARTLPEVEPQELGIPQQSAGPAPPPPRPEESVRARSVPRPDAGAEWKPPKNRGEKRLFYYRPPGARVGDSGERGPVAQGHDTRPSLESVEGLVYRWVETLLRGDLDGHISLYAPELQGRARDSLRAEKHQLIAELANVSRFEVYDLRVNKSPGRLVRAEFRTEWTGNTTHSTRHALTLRQANGAWLIVVEEHASPVSRRQS